VVVGPSLSSHAARGDRARTAATADFRRVVVGAFFFVVIVFFYYRSSATASCTTGLQICHENSGGVRGRHPHRRASEQKVLQAFAAPRHLRGVPVPAGPESRAAGAGPGAARGSRAFPTPGTCAAAAPAPDPAASLSPPFCNRRAHASRAGPMGGRAAREGAAQWHKSSSGRRCHRASCSTSRGSKRFR